MIPVSGPVGRFIFLIFSLLLWECGKGVSGHWDWAWQKCMTEMLLVLKWIKLKNRKTKECVFPSTQPKFEIVIAHILVCDYELKYFKLHSSNFKIFANMNCICLCPHCGPHLKRVLTSSNGEVWDMLRSARHLMPTHCFHQRRKLNIMCE